MAVDAAATPGAILAERVAIVVVAAVFLAKAATALSLGLDGDEAYYTMWSAFLAPGYLDHPPGVALVIALGRLVAGDSLLGVRLVPLVASLVISAAIYRTGRLLLPGTAASAVAVIWYNLTLITAANFVATPDVPSTLFWTLGLWAAAEAATRARPGWWLLVGLFAGLGLVAKYTNVFFGAGLVAWLLLTPTGRRELRRWQIWAGGALALAVFSPVLWWNAENGWVSFLFQGARVWTFKDLESFGQPMREFLIGQAGLVGPILLAGSVVGTVLFAIGAVRRRPVAGLALPVLTSLPLLLYFLVHALHSKVEANWTQPVLPAMTLVAAWLVTRPLAGGWRLWLSRAAIWLQVLSGIAAVAALYAQSVFQPLDLGAADRARLLRGWGETTARIRAIADAEQVGAVWTMGTYRLAGEVFSYGLFAGDDRPVRPTSRDFRYGFIPDAARFPSSLPALLVTEVRSPDRVAPPEEYFAVSRLVEVVPRGHPGRYDAYYAVFVVDEPTGALPLE